MPSTAPCSLAKKRADRSLQMIGLRAAFGAPAELRGRPESNGTRAVDGPAPKASLAAAAINQGRQPPLHPPPHIKGPLSPWALNLWNSKRGGLIIPVDVDIHPAWGLSRVGMQEPPAIVGYLGDGAERRKRADLIVRGRN